jgi:hypothetical protein
MLRQRAYRVSLLLSVGMAGLVVVVMVIGAARAGINEVCALTFNNNNATSSCQDCPCGCTPPPAPPCPVAPDSGSKEFIGMRRCIDLPEDLCEFERQEQNCAIRWGWAFTECDDNPANFTICHTVVTTTINCKIQ